VTLLTPSPDIQILISLAREAAREIMTVYSSDFAVKSKADLSPVTEADERAEAVILRGLAEAYPQVPVLAEEQAAAGRMPEVADEFFLVDPLDGTKEFLSRNGEFTVNIAKIVKGRPVAGVVYAPAIAQLFWGEAGQGAAMARTECATGGQAVAWTPVHVAEASAEGLRVVASRSHRDAETDAYLAKLHVRDIVAAGSSLKFCKVACGEADLYPRFGRTMEWDTAAGQAVLEAAGGTVVTLDGLPLRYGKRERGYDNPGFIAKASA
jgi:3'(2'),5'-bisphosphate nucleotidase